MALETDDHKIKRLYKYRPDNDHTLNILKNNELYFSFVEDFNDPFDCRVNLLLPNNKKEWEDHAKKHKIPDVLASQAIKALEQLNYDSEKVMKLYEKTNFKTITLCCLSEVKDNILMWSHYSNSHRGISIGFETIIDQNSLCIKTDDPTLNNHDNPVYHKTIPIDKVEYKINYPEPYDFLTNNHHDLYKFFKTKSIDWQYERERRITMPYRDIKKRLIKYDKSALKEVILGCKTNDEFKQQVISLIKNEYSSKGYTVDIFQSSIDRNDYRLNINKLN